MAQEWMLRSRTMSWPWRALAISKSSNWRWLGAKVGGWGVIFEVGPGAVFTSASVGPSEAGMARSYLSVLLPSLEERSCDGSRRLEMRCLAGDRPMVDIPCSVDDCPTNRHPKYSKRTRSFAYKIVRVWGTSHETSGVWHQGFLGRTPWQLVRLGL